VTPSWDNSARRKIGATIFHGSTPDLYRKWLQAKIRAARETDNSYRLIFINAWNEWGEGNHLEPDLRFGRAYLEATRRALQNI
jgi:lipopolysaccharide biosynthesis protein